MVNEGVIGVMGLEISDDAPVVILLVWWVLGDSFLSLPFLAF